MALPVTFQNAVRSAEPLANIPAPRAPKSEPSGIGHKFEQMLWTEMLSHAGLDKAFSQGGGEAASAFSRYVVESIAKDLAETHPMGLGEAVDQSIADRQVQQEGGES